MSPSSSNRPQSYERRHSENDNNASRSLSPSGAPRRWRGRNSNDHDNEMQTPTTHAFLTLSTSSDLHLRPQLSRAAELNAQSQDHLQDDNCSCASSSSSSTCSSLWEDHPYSLAHPADMKYSLISNALFLVGSALQSYLAIWDVMAAQTAEDNGSDDDGGGGDDGMDDDDPHPLLFINNKEHLYDSRAQDFTNSELYQTLYSLGPFLFILNAMVDIWWALAASRRATGSNSTHSRSLLSLVQTMFHYWVRSWWSSILSLISIDLGLEQQHLHGDDDDDDTSTMGHTWDLGIAVFFGVGAVLEFYSTFFDDDDIHAKGYITAYYVNMISMHTYLISGLLAVQKDRDLFCTFGGSYAKCLMSAGILLFLMGSVLDCVISYLYDPDLLSDNVISQLTLTTCNLASSVLWFVDAIFYIWADCLVFGVLSKLIQKGRAVKQRLFQERNNSRSREFTSQLSLPLVRGEGGDSAIDA